MMTFGMFVSRTIALLGRQLHLRHRSIYSILPRKRAPVVQNTTNTSLDRT